MDELHTAEPEGTARSVPLRAPGEAFALLDRVRVLDLTTSIAGPYATLQLADLGATVVKVEPPGRGDDARGWGPPFLDDESLWFLSVNRNKQSLTLDIGKPAGLGVLRELIEQADVFVTNLRARQQRKKGIDYDAVRAIKPDIVYCAITGFGLSGPRHELPCYDLIAEGYSGIMDLTGEAHGDPQKVGTPAADLLAGMDAAYGVVGALFDRERTGRSHLVDVSLVESMTRFLAPRIVPYLGSDDPPPTRSGGRDSVIAVYQGFETADDPLTLGLGNDEIFRRFCTAIERPEWARDARYADNVARRRHRAELVSAIAERLAEEGRTYWLERFAHHGVPAGPINGVADVVANDQLAARGFFFGIPGTSAAWPQVGTGWHLDGRPNGYRSPPPRLGADTEAVLGAWLGLSATRIAELRRDGIV